MSRADDIQRMQSELQKELDKIQKECTHKVRTIRWSDYTKDYMWQCKRCNARISYPSISEINEYLS